MVAIGTLITIAAVAIIILAILGAIFAKSTTPEPEPEPVYVKAGAVKYRRITRQ